MGLPKIGLEAILDDRNFQRGLGAYMRGVDQMQRRTDQVAHGIGGQFLTLGNGVLKAAGLVAGAVVGIASAGATALALVGKDAVQTSISIETAFAGVIKTTDGLTSDFGVLNEAGRELKQGFKDLAGEVPIAVEELMRIGELGGQWGIGKDVLLDFTRTIADIGVSTDLTTEEAALGFARFMNIMGTAQGEVGRVGSAIVDLGNNFATTEPEILDFAERIAGAGKIAGLTEADVLGIAAAFSSVGVQAEAGGTATQKTLFTITQAVSEGGEALDILAGTAGMTAGQFQRAWREDAGGAFAAFVQGLGGQGQEAIKTLAALGLEDQRLVRGFLSLASAGPLVEHTIARSNEAWEENTALTNEAAQRYATTESKMALLRNQVRNIKDDIGSALLPAWNGLLGVMGQLVEKYGPLVVQFFQDSIVPAVEAVGRALALLIEGDVSGALSELVGPETAAQILEVAGAIQEFIGQAVAFVGEHAEAFQTALTVIGAILAGAAIAAAITGIAGAIASLANPVTLIIAAVGLLAAAWAGNWGGIREKTQSVIDWLTPFVTGAIEWIRQFWADNGEQIIETVTGLWQAVTGAFQTAIDWIRTAVSDVLEALRRWWAKWGDDVRSIVNTFWEYIQSIWQTATDLISGIFEAFRLALAGDWEGFGAKLRETAETFLSNVWEVFQTKFELVKELVGLVIGNILDLWHNTDWGAIGRGVIDGIKNGITAGLGAIKEAARNAARAALEAAKGFLGISSPSAVTAEMIGQPFVLGIGEGIQDAIRQLERVTLPEVTARLVSGVDMPTVRPPAGAALAGMSRTEIGGARTYELHIHTSAPVENVVADFHMLEALA